MDYDEGFSNLYNKWNSSERGKKFLEFIGISRDKLDIVSMSKLYFSKSEEDRTIDVNANVGRITSPNNYQAEVFKGVTKLNGLFLLWQHMSKKRGEETASRVVSGIISGDYYFHDLTSSGVLVPYCFAWASNNVLSEGRKYGQLQSKSPKRSDSFIAVCIESIFDMAQEQMGALAIPDFIVNLAYFYKKEGIDPESEEGKYKIENDFQRIIHSLNQQYRTSNQSAFTNFSLFDREIFRTTFADYSYPDGTSCLDLTEYIQSVQKVYIEFVAKKDPSTKLPYRFPVNTLNIYTTEDREIVDQKFFDVVCKNNTEGLFNIFISRGKAKLASCCRLLSDPIKLREFARFDSFANAGLSLGSARVVTVNFARIGKLAKNDKDRYFFLLSERLNDVRMLLKCQRHLLKQKIDEGFLKFFKMDWMNMKMFFSTFGMTGLNESMLFMGIDIKTDEGIEFAKELFFFIEKKLDEFSREDSIAYNLEQVPAEGAASMLARMDKLYFNDEDYPYEIYANQFIPLWEKSDIVERATLDGKLGSYMSGGSICHLNIGTKVTEKQMGKLINLAIKSGLEHFALNPNYLKCENDCITIGSNNVEICPKCGGKIVEAFSRIVGYFTPVTQWDKTRRTKDYANRTFNDIDIIEGLCQKN